MYDSIIKYTQSGEEWHLLWIRTTSHVEKCVLTYKYYREDTNWAKNVKKDEDDGENSPWSYTLST